MSLSDLPDQLLVVLFGMLPTADRLRLSETCSRLRSLLFYPTLWTNFKLSLERRRRAEEAIVNESVALFFHKVPHNCISHIDWRLDNQYLPTLLQLCSTQHSLSLLQIVDDKFSNENLEQICASVFGASLRHVGITGSNYLTGDKLLLIAKHMPNIHSIDLSYSNRIKDEEFHAFLCNFNDNQFVSVILDNVNWLEDVSIAYLTRKHGTSLQVLSIDGENNTDALFESIGACCNLKSLVVSFAQNLTDTALERLSASQKFREICFRKGGSFSKQGLASFLSRCNFSNLTSLNLSECSNLCNAGALLIATHCSHLTHLYLCWCWEVDETGILPIVTCCSKMLLMDLTGMHQLTGQSFLLIPDTMPHLEMLKLEMCNNIQDDILHLVVIRMKGKLVVINYYFENIVYDPSNDIEFDIHAISLEEPSNTDLNRDVDTN